MTSIVPVWMVFIPVQTSTVTATIACDSSYTSSFNFIQIINQITENDGEFCIGIKCVLSLLGSPLVHSYG